MSVPDPPRFEDVLAARERIRPHLPRTAFHRYPALDEVLGFSCYVKHENHQPVGAFKVRGGVNLVSQLPEDVRARGVIAASTGNHGQSVAFAAHTFGARAVIVVPEAANPAKVEAMRAWGADVRFHGANYDEAKRHVEALTDEEGFRYVHSANEPDLIAGVGTYALEMVEDVPDLDAILVPVGGGSGACGCLVVRDARARDCEVIGVQSAQAPAAYRSWKERAWVEAPAATFAEGLATGAPFELTQSMMREGLNDFVLVDDADIRRAVLLLLEKTRNLAEGAGAAAMAAGMTLRDRLKGRKVGVVLSGGNLSLDQLRSVLGAAA